MQASLRSLQAEVDMLHHEKQQQQPPINYASDLNAAAARYIQRELLYIALLHSACVAKILRLLGL